MQTETENEHFGLKPDVINRINSVFSGYPNIEQVIIYGSRAKGTYRNGSDIDLALRGTQLTASELITAETQLDELLLPYKIDLCLFDSIQNPDLIEHIKRVGKPFS